MGAYAPPTIPGRPRKGSKIGPTRCPLEPPLARTGREGPTPPPRGARTTQAFRATERPTYRVERPKPITRQPRPRAAPLTSNPERPAPAQSGPGGGRAQARPPQPVRPRVSASFCGSVFAFGGPRGTASCEAGRSGCWSSRCAGIYASLSALAPAIRSSLIRLTTLRLGTAGRSGFHAPGPTKAT